MKTNKLIYILSVFCVALFAACAKSAKEDKTKEIIPEVFAIESVKADINWDIMYPATVTGVEVRSKVSGNLKEIMYEEGSFVKKGSSMFTVDRPANKAAYDRASFVIGKAKQDYEKSAAQFNKFRDLYRKGSMKKKDYDIAAQEHKKIEKEYSDARQAMKDAEEVIKNTKITAPVSGIAGMSLYKIDDEISRKEGTEVLTYIFDSEPLKATFLLPREQADNFMSGYWADKIKDDGKVVKGAIPVEPVFADENSSQVKGSIVSIQISSDTDRFVAIDAEFKTSKESKSMIPGQQIKMKMPEAYFQGAVIILKVCIFRDFVFVVQPDGTLKEVPVTYEPHGEYAFVTSGLEGGENVVSFSSGSVEAGKKVSVKQRYFSVPEDFKYEKPFAADVE